MLCGLRSCANKGTHSTSAEQAFCSAPSIGTGGTDLPAVRELVLALGDRRLELEHVEAADPCGAEGVRVL